MVNSPSNWMASAVPPSHKGIFTAKAKKAGMSVPKYAAKEKNSSNTKLARQSNLAETFEKLAGK